MKYISVSSQTTANQQIRIVLFQIWSTKYFRRMVGYSVRLQRFYEQWQPMGKRLSYGYNAWDFQTRVAGEQKMLELFKKYEGG